MTVTAEAARSPSPLLVLRRRGRALLLAAGAVLLLAALAALFWPARYSATGVILIEQQELPSDLVRSTVSSYASQRIQVISQRVMTTENLMGIIQRDNLYADLRKRHPREEVIKEMRGDTSLQMISADVIDPREGRPTKATIAFSISYSSPSAELASRVANELVSLYLQQNIESREQSSRDAEVFLTGESSRLLKEIKEVQAKIADFKAQHANELPELMQLNQQKMQHTEEEIRDTDAQLRSLDQQITYLDAQLAQINPTAQVYASTGERVQSPADRLKYVRTEYARVLALYSPDHPDVRRLKREMEGLEAAAAAGADAKGDANDGRRQLEEAQTELTSAQKRYSPDHPDVVRLERLVASLRARVENLAPAASSTTAAAGEGPLEKPANASADNPPYIQIQAQREAALSEVRSLRRKREELQTTRAGLERHLAETPAVERDYTVMLRDLDSLQSQYRVERLKQNEAQTAENLESERKGERFTLIEPPFPPEEPTSPNRRLILLFGAVGALGVGAATALLLDALDGSVRGRHDLEALLSTPPLAMIPLIRTREDRVARRRRRYTALYGALGAMLVGIVLIHLLYRPLDVLWLAALRRLGVES
ncbi:MAG: lipopolysaccharide biosynthesis protein [Gammaproteobacteria bacterium]|nr:lipopolysaccharide biosynthesis protein [Gammaproteobacteria bacterium]MBV8308044.1 lipopolysaccharide biosynthesis protein [Gammaproteobacteria bacterium]MBV8403434.1 lipopolysaccharide biosynthesis protein [Gammaproteobacteria bacterium]